MPIPYIMGPYCLNNPDDDMSEQEDTAITKKHKPAALPRAPSKPKSLSASKIKSVTSDMTVKDKSPKSTPRPAGQPAGSSLDMLEVGPPPQQITEGMVTLGLILIG